MPLETAVVDRIHQRYGLTVDRVTFLGGEVDRNYRLTTPEGTPYLAKVQLPVHDGAALGWQEAILMHLVGTDVGVAVPTIVPSADGCLHVGFEYESEPGILRVLDWVDGTELNQVAEHSPALLRQIGATAARVTDALRGFSWPGLPATHHWDIERSGEVIGECIAAAPDLADRHGADTVLGWFTDIEPMLADLPRALVHHDLNDNNILVVENGDTQTVSGILDFNDALFSVRVAEPAIAGAYAMLRKDDPLTAFGHVVAGYHSVSPLSPAELAVVYPLAVARLCMQVSTWTVRGRANPTDYGSMRMRNTLPTLERLLRIDPAVATAQLRQGL